MTISKNKIFLIIVILILISSIVFFFAKDNNDQAEEKIEAEIPAKCQDVKDDVCALFSCMVDMCWCNEIIPGGPVEYSEDKEILNTNDASLLVENYLKIMSSAYSLYEISNTVDLNGYFYNVFVSDGEGNENVYTVSADGKIILTFCGV